VTALRCLRRRVWLPPAAAVLSAAVLSVGAIILSGPGAGATQRASATSLGATAYAAAVGPAPPSTQLDLELPLVADDAGLARFASAVSTPGSPEYGHFESVEALTARFGAKPGIGSAVARYLRSAGARAVSLHSVGQFVSATMTVADAQRTFGTRLGRFQTADGQQYIAPSVLAHGASAQPPLPAGLRGLVTGVAGLDTQSLAASSQKPALTQPAHVSTPADVARLAAGGAHTAANQPTSAYLPRSGTASGCSGARRTGSFTPNQYLTAYGYRGLHNQGLQGQGERAALIEIDGYRASDINGFVRCFRLPYPHISVHPVGGLRRPLGPGGETTLDLELMTAAAPRLSNIYVYESRGSAGHVLRAYSAALARGRRPQVISASLGICEPLALDTMGKSGINGIERILSTAAASGVSVLASAGDQGSSSCVLLGHIQHRLAVSYPASSPWVTGVGGTNALLYRDNHIRGQVVWNDTHLTPDAGGGGVSILFGRPDFQTGLLSTVRVVPDVAMLADLAPGYAIFCTVKGPDCGRGGWTGAGGTSAAAPLLAGGIALIDQDLRRHHRHGLGDLNPLLYYIGGSGARAAVFSDVLAINNDLGPYLPGGHGQPLGCCAAAPAFDAASGWGTVDVSSLARFVVPASKQNSN
jgi:subtilase family serine protease